MGVSALTAFPVLVCLAFPWVSFACLLSLCFVDISTLTHPVVQTMFMICLDCRAPLDPDDGHELCPSCLGLDHLKEGLTELACIHCSCLSMACRKERLALVEGGKLPSVRGGTVPPGPQKRPRAERQEPPGRPPAKLSKVDLVAQRVDTMAAEFAELKAILLGRQQPAAAIATASSAVAAPASDDREMPMLSPAVTGPEDDVLSTRASESLATVDEWDRPGATADEDVGPVSSLSSPRGSVRIQGSVVLPTLKAALAQLGLDVPATEAAPQSAFFQHTAGPSEFTVPPSAPYIAELQRCWADPRRFAHRTSDVRALANMRDAATYGLGSMPGVEPTLAAIIVSPDEALRPDARCPRPQCRITDDYICKGYDAAARAARIGNSMSHMLLALSQSLQSSEVEPAIRDLTDSLLQAFAYMAREQGRVMSHLTSARRQVWLAQSPLSEPCRRSLRSLPVVPGHLFGPAAQDALQRGLQVSQARRQYASLRQLRTPAWRPSSVARQPSATTPPAPQPRPPAARRFRQPSAGQRARQGGMPGHRPPRGGGRRGRRQ